MNMKYLYTPLLALLLFSCQKEEKKIIDRAKTDWAFYKLNGDVESVSEKWYKTVNGVKGASGNEDPAGHDTDLEFDDSGMLVLERKWLNATMLFEEFKYKGHNQKTENLQYMGGKAAIRTTYGWDNTGKNNTSIIRKNIDNSPIDRVEMKYKGNKMAEKSLYNMQDNVTDKTMYRYDKKGNLIEEDLFLGAELMQYKTRYEYNADNLKIWENRTDKDSKLIYKTAFEYENGHLATSYSVNNKGEKDYIEKFTYDAKGNILTRYTYEGFDGSETLDTFTYDAKGNKATWIVIKNKLPIINIDYTYDARNNLTAMKIKDENGRVETRAYKYEFDKQGNWTKKTTLYDERPAFITERKITYYTMPE